MGMIKRGHGMLNKITALAVVAMIGAAFILYSEGIETRRLEQSVQEQQQLRDRLSGAIADLKARRAELSRPGRIEPAARALGMRPSNRTQSVSLEDFAGSPPNRPSRTNTIRQFGQW